MQLQLISLIMSYIIYYIINKVELINQAWIIINSSRNHLNQMDHVQRLAMTLSYFIGFQSFLIQNADFYYSNRPYIF
jgi:hypothetical protein